MGMDRSPVKTRGQIQSGAIDKNAKYNTDPSADKFGETYTKVNEVNNSICGSCHINIGDHDDSIQCDHCHLWNHVKCSGMDIKTYSHLAKLDSFDWTCVKCKSEIRLLKEESERIRNENIFLKKENETLKNRLTTLEKRLEDLKVELKNDIVSDVLKELKEVDEKKSRESNLIIYNMPESLSNDAKERKIEDEKLCEKIFLEGVKVERQDFSIDGIIRLGKSRPIQDQCENSENQKPRPVLVKLQTGREKWNILKKAKNLRNCQHNGMKRIGIAPDLTVSEREIDRKLRNELKTRRESGDNDWYIKNGKLIKKNFQQRH